jgi:hypothetical protein
MSRFKAPFRCPGGCALILALRKFCRSPFVRNSVAHRPRGILRSLKMCQGSTTLFWHQRANHRQQIWTSNCGKVLSSVVQTCSGVRRHLPIPTLLCNNSSCDSGSITGTASVDCDRISSGVAMLAPLTNTSVVLA